MSKTIAIGESISFGWKAFKAHAGFTLLAGLIIYGSSLLLNYVIEREFGGIQPTEAFLTMLASLVTMWLSFNLIRAWLRIVDGQRPSINDLFRTDGSLVWYFIGSILYGLMLFAGFLLLVIPGIYLSLRYGLYIYVIADRGSNPFEAFRESARLTAGVKWRLILFSLALAGVALLGSLLLFVGLIVAIPVISLAYTWVYRSLTQQTAHELPVVATPVAIVPSVPETAKENTIEAPEEKKTVAEASKTASS